MQQDQRPTRIDHGESVFCVIYTLGNDSKHYPRTVFFMQVTLANESDHQQRHSFNRYGLCTSSRLHWFRPTTQTNIGGISISCRLHQPTASGILLKTLIVDFHISRGWCTYLRRRTAWIGRIDHDLCTSLSSNQSCISHVTVVFTQRLANINPMLPSLFVVCTYFI